MDQVESLLRVQESDLAIMRTRKRLDEMPEKQAILAARKRIREFKELLARIDALVAETDRTLARQEDDTVALSQKIETEQHKILSGEVTNPKELQNLSRELDALGRKKEKAENETLGLMEKREKAGEQRAKVVAAIADAETKEKALVVDFQRKGGDLLREIETRQQQRAAALDGLDPELVKRYEAARETKGGIGIGVLGEDMCSACRVGLPSERVAVLREAGAVGTCPNCKRLLIVEQPKEKS